MSSLADDLRADGEHETSLHEENKREYFFEPRKFSDLNLHYRSATYHLHRAMMYKESHYFREIVESDDLNRNDRCDQCQKSNAQCIDLPEDKIGGANITATQLYEFLLYVYYSVNVADLSPWRKSLAVGDHVEFKDQADQWVLGQISSISFDQYVTTRSSEDCSGSTFKYRLDSLKLKQPSPSWQSSLQLGSLLEACDTTSVWLPASVERAEPTRLFIRYTGWADKWNEWIERDSKRIRPIKLDDDPLSKFDPSNCPILHLSSYFLCDKLLQRYQNRSLATLQDTKTQVWKVLLLAERQHWGDVKQACIQRLISSADFVKDEHWISGYRSISHETLAEILKAYVMQHSA